MRSKSIVERLVSEMNARGGVTIEALPTRAPIAPTRMDATLQSHIESAAERQRAG